MIEMIETVSIIWIWIEMIEMIDLKAFASFGPSSEASCFMLAAS